MKKIAVVLMVLFFQACETVGSVSRPTDYYRNPTSADVSSIVDEVTIGDDDGKIAQLLHHQTQLPRKSRVAILKMGSDASWRFYSTDFTELTEGLVKGLVERLRASDRIYDASFLPSMLVPERPTIPILREAAARFQADLLLAYRNVCASYEKYRFLSSDETKSYCSVEAIVLETRSGVIVKSVVSTENFTASKQASDTNFAETQKRAELAATATALGKIAKEIVLYLESVPVQKNL